MKRIKRRYLAVGLDGDFHPSEGEYLDAVWSSITRLYGEFGASLTGLALITYDVERRTGVLRVNLVALNNVRAALALVTAACGKDMSVHVLGVSGTIKALRAKTKV